MIKLKGHYQLTARKEDGRRRHLAAFDNLITNAGLNALLASSFSPSHCQVGTGRVVELPVDTTLTALHRATNVTVVENTTNVSNNNPFTTTFSKTFRFGLGEVTADVTEIGVGSNATGSLFSKSLIKDILGNPTSIRVFSDEYLEVSYFVDIVPIQEDIPFTMVVKGEPVPGYIRAANVNNPTRWSMVRPTLSASRCYAYAGTVGARTGEPSGTRVAATDVVQAAYITNSFYLDFTVRWNETVANWSEGISAVLLDRDSDNLFSFQLGFLTPIRKLDTESFRIRFRVMFGNG